MKRSLTDNPPARNVRANAFVAQMRRAERAALANAIERENVAELERAAIAERIAQARIEAGLSQPEMAEVLGVHERTYQNYESAAKPRTPWSLMNQIATITGKTTEWLIHGDGTTPELLKGMPLQLDGVTSEFHQRVDEVERRLDKIEEALGEQAEGVRGLLKRQSEILERIEGLVATLPTDETTRRLLEAIRGAA